MTALVLLLLVSVVQPTPSPVEVMQAAIDAGQPVELPAGVTEIDRPLISSSKLFISGKGKLASTLKATHRGEAIVGMGPQQRAKDYVDADGWILEGSWNKFLNLSDGWALSNIDGKPFSVAFDFRRDWFHSDQRTIIASGGALTNTLATYRSVFSIYTIGNDIHCRFRADGKDHVLTLPAPELGSWGWVYFSNRDGLASFSVGTETVIRFVGPIEQAWHECIYLGPTQVRWPDNVAIAPAPQGRVKNLEIRSGDDWLTCSLTDTSTRPFIQAQTRYGVEWHTPRWNVVDHGVAVDLHDFSIEGGMGGMFLSNTRNARIANIATQYSRRGLYLWSQSYSNTVSGCSFTGGSGTIGIGCVAQGVLNNIRDCSVSHFKVPFLFADGGGSITDCFGYGGNMRVGLLAKGDNVQLRVNGFNTGDENQPPPYADASILCSDVKGVSLASVTVWNGHQTGPGIWLDNCDGAVITAYAVHASKATELVRFTRPPVKPALLLGYSRFGAGMDDVPLTLTPTAIREVD